MKRIQIYLAEILVQEIALMISWVRSHSKNKFDKEGQLASMGKNDIILETAFELYSNRLNQKKNHMI